MRGVIIDVKDRFTYVLDESGTFRKVYTKPTFKAGGEITLNETQSGGSRRMRIRALSAVAACFVLLLGGGIFAKSWDSTAYTVYVDINPSVRVDVNKYGRVISQQALNEDGVVLLDQTAATGNVKEAISALVKGAKDEGRITDYGVAVTMAGGGMGNYDQLANMTGTDISGTPLHLDYVSRAEENAALANGATPSKYQLAVKAHEVCSNLPVSTAVKLQAEYLRDIISGKIVWAG